jgi:heme-degrading monooxygenase HmoA
MLCALTVRQLKPGTFDRFADEFGPRQSEGPPRGWIRFDMIRDLADENRVVTFGFFDGTLEDLERSQAEGGYEDRRAAVEELVEEVPVNGVFEVVREMTPA